MYTRVAAGRNFAVMEAVFLIHFSVCVFMTGLIWFVQVVHYPLFLRVPPESFTSYESDHTAKTGRIVMLPMLVELATGVALCMAFPFAAGLPIFLCAFGLLVVVWLSTAFIQVPQHRKLTSDPDRKTIRSLVRWNWVRTLAWTARSLLLGSLFLW